MLGVGELASLCRGATDVMSIFFVRVVVGDLLGAPGGGEPLVECGACYQNITQGGGRTLFWVWAYFT